MLQELPPGQPTKGQWVRSLARWERTPNPSAQVATACHASLWRRRCRHRGTNYGTVSADGAAGSLSDQLGDVHHAFRRAVMKDFPRAKAAERVPDLDVPTFWRIVNQTPEFVRAAYVTIAALGLRVGEYLRHGH